jgi:hypothetical protein
MLVAPRLMSAPGPSAIVAGQCYTSDPDDRPDTSDFGCGNGIFTQFLQQPTFNTQFNVNTSPGELNTFAISPPSPFSAVQTKGSALTQMIRTCLLSKLTAASLFNIMAGPIH